MMSEKVKRELELLRFKRSSLLKKVTNLHQLSLEVVIESEDNNEFEVRFKKLESDYEAINRCQAEIVKCLLTLGQNDQIENEEKSLELLDEMYFRILATHKKLYIGGNLNQSVAPQTQQQVRLPKIELPTFNGNLKDWPHFKDMFVSLIHNNESLPEVEKFHYLVSCLRSEPLSLSKTLPMTTQNYCIIWDQLKERYDNKRLLASCYLEEILNVPKLTNESPQKLRHYLDSFIENTTALCAMRFPVDCGDFILSYVILQKLDKHTRQLFERKYSSVEFPKFENIVNFLKDHCKSLEVASLLDKDSYVSGVLSKPKSGQPMRCVNYKTSNATSPNVARHSFVSTNAQVRKHQCLHCNEDHSIYRCPDFSALSVSERRDFIKSKQACFNCLSHGHMSRACSSNVVCKICSRNHHTMLHESSKVPLTTTAKTLINVNQATSQETVTKSASSTSAHTASHLESSGTTILLGTAAIQIKDSSGNYVTMRALCDPGSQMSFITQDCARKLSLSIKPCNMPIIGISQSVTHSTQGIVDCHIKPRFKNYPCLLTNAVILDRITTDLPCQALPSNIREVYKNLDLADPYFDVPGQIDFLIGADLYPEVFDGGRKPTKPGYPTPYRTIFGWVLIGKTSSHSEKMITSNLCVTDVHSVDASIKKFWELEEVPKRVHVSLEDQDAETMFCETHSRMDSGRYVVKLPFRSEPPCLGDSYEIAAQSFKRLEARLNYNPILKEQYSQFMLEYLDLGHMTVVNVDEVQPKYFIPHHGVYKLGQDARTPQLRVVFNASAKTTNGKSLNDELLTGPKLQNDICEVVSNFRLHPIVFTADICKMYRQIIVDPEHRTYQAILWRFSPKDSTSCFLLNTVTYGVSSAPYLAIRTLQQLAYDEGQKFPLAAKALMKDIFVDDLLVGSETLESALKLKSDLISLLQLGGFELKKWASNHPDLLTNATEPNKEINFNESDAISVLGIKWQPVTDEFMYKVKLNNFRCNSKPTKRLILSLLSTIFDPLGWVTPVVLCAKKLMQSLWTLGVGWDDLLEENVLRSWHLFIDELPLLEDVRIPRLVIPTNSMIYQLHGFADASSEAYGACLYLRCETSNGEISTNLIVAKSKVAPLKSLTIPKLELCACVLLSKLLDFYKQSSNAILGALPVFAWSDSTVALSWIRTPPHQLKPFVANRVAAIQDIIEPSYWFHVPTLDNPADCSSRGMLPSRLLTHSLWWKGPKWLSEDQSSWPKNSFAQIPATDLPELKHTVVCSAATEPNLSFDILERYSSLTRLKRVTAWCLRFKTNCKLKSDQRTYGPLSTQELHYSLNICVRMTQNQSFSHEISTIKSKLTCKPEFQRLDPFIDEAGILRVGGRLRHSSLQYPARHPAILPKSSHITNLLIDHYHNMYFHIGPRTLQSLLQRCYWILSARNAIRKRILRCLKCTRLKGKCPQPFMADLPAYRVNAYRPFLKVGVDFGGPFFIKTERSRKPQIRKAYLCLFICLATKAIHLEVVSDLSTDAFLAAFDRFIARRGICTDVYSDRGTNFVGAKNELSNLYNLMKNSSSVNLIMEKLSNRGINWHLNPPSAPHFGGIWEAGIKSAKAHLLHVIGDQSLTFEELSTVFVQIEAVLNSRPLCPISSDTAEIDVLTPGHFLIGQPLVSVPQQDLADVPKNRLSRWQLLNQVRQHFWKRWSNEYLHTLQQRTKWISRKPTIQEGDLVLIKDDNLPPQTWRQARVTSLLPGKDGIARVARLRTNQGELIRPVVKLCPLPVNN